MRARLLVAIGLVTGFAIPVGAQLTCEGPQDSCRALVDLTAKYAAAINKNDAAGLAALYTSDAVIVGEAPIASGRESIEKTFGDLFKGGGWSNHTANVIQVHVIDDMAWRFGDWSAMGPGADHTTQKYHGYWSTVNQREGGDWKIREETWNVIETPPE